jgi:hypothetical protein
MQNSKHFCSSQRFDFMWTHPEGGGGCFSGIKRAQHEADHSPPSIAEVKIHGAISPLLLASSWHGGVYCFCCMRYEFNNVDRFHFTVYDILPQSSR